MEASSRKAFIINTYASGVERVDFCSTSAQE